MIIKPEQELKNKTQLLDMAGLLLSLKNEFFAKHPDEDEDVLRWCIEQSIMRLSVNTGHSFE